MEAWDSIAALAQTAEAAAKTLAVAVVTLSPLKHTEDTLSEKPTASPRHSFAAIELPHNACRQVQATAAGNRAIMKPAADPATEPIPRGGPVIHSPPHAINAWVTPTNATRLSATRMDVVALERNRGPEGPV